MPSLSRDRVVVVGGGIAGLATALKLAPMPVTLLAQARLGLEAATPRAQGGIAAAVAADDEPALHAADTLAAGDGLCDPPIAARVTAAAPACIDDLIAHGVVFDRCTGGALALGLEAAHSRRRIVHAGGDGTGRAIMEALIRAARATAAIEILEGVRATGLCVEDGAVTGVHAAGNEAPIFLPARAVVLASGGTGGLYLHTTNPLGATGSGLALAARAGAILRDLEFVQFHPTAIALPSGAAADPMPLASEAVRGEGAILVNGRGERFMEDVPGKELAARDIVARAVFSQIAAGETVFLDARGALGERFPERFPTVTALCREAGMDPATQPIPVRPAAHYHMGGVAVDGRGRSSVPGLWACGEVAASGLHGANRLASNSLLEALAFAGWIASDISGLAATRTARLPGPARVASAPAEYAASLAADAASLAEIRRLMSSAVGVVRDDTGLALAMARLGAIALGRAQRSRAAGPALVGLFIAMAARERRESRGAHARRDHPARSGAWTRRIELTLEDLRARLQDLPAQYSVARGA